MDLVARGASVFPVTANAKDPPLVLFSSEASNDPAQVGAWAKKFPGCNWAVHTGMSELAGADEDNKNGKHGAATAFNLELDGKVFPPTYTVKTPNDGYHRYYRGTAKSGTDILGPGLDIKSAGNAYLIAPGSVIDGKRYEVVDDRPFEKVPDWVVETAGAATTTEKASREPLVDLDLPENIQLAERYLVDNAPEAVEGAGGDAQTYQVACKVRDLGVSEGTCQELMLEHWNEQKASPPWSPDDLTQKVRNAYRYARGAAGAATPAAMFRDDEAADVASLQASKTPAPGRRPQVEEISGEKLMKTDFPPIQWLVLGLIAAGLVILAGKAKLGKSWLVLDLMMAVSCGGYFMGIQVQKGSALYLALEDTPRRLQDRLRRLLEGPNTVGPGLTLVTRFPGTDEERLQYVERWIREHPDARVIAIDTFEKVRPKRSKNGNVYADDYAAIAPFKDLADRYGVTIIVVTHIRKADSSDVFDKVSGSTGLTGAADETLILDRPRFGTGATLSVTGRDVEESSLALEFDKGAMRWQLLGKAYEIEQSQERKEIVSVLNEATGELSPKQVAERLEKYGTKDVNAVTKLLGKLRDQGQIASTRRGYYASIFSEEV